MNTPVTVLSLVPHSMIVEVHKRRARIWCVVATAAFQATEKAQPFTVEAEYIANVANGLSWAHAGKSDGTHRHS